MSPSQGHGENKTAKQLGRAQIWPCQRRALRSDLTDRGVGVQVSLAPQ